jgi:hypothetical protein
MFAFDIWSFLTKKQKLKKIPAAVWHGVKGLTPCRSAAGS